MPWPAIAAGVNFLGGLTQNRAQAGEARKQRRFTRAEAEKNRGFQERMRNTEWQAGVADMRAAGLNPALAYQQGGASSPGGSMGSGAMAGVENVVSEGVSSAMEARRVKEEMKLMKQQFFKTQAETYQTLAGENLTDQQRIESEERTKGIQWNNELLRLSVPGARNVANLEGGRAGQGTRTIRSLLESFIGGGGNALGDFRPGR